MLPTVRARQGEVMPSGSYCRERITSVSKLQFQHFFGQETFSLYQLLTSEDANILL